MNTRPEQKEKKNGPLGGIRSHESAFSLHSFNEPLHPANVADFTTSYYRKRWDNHLEKRLTYQTGRTPNCVRDSTCFIAHLFLITQSVHWNYI